MVLSHEQDGKERAFSYAGKKLSESEIIFTVTEREGLTAVIGLKHGRV